MRFNGREWVNDIVTTAVTASIAGLVWAKLVPDQSMLDAVVIAGIGGLVTGMVLQPLKWLLEQRPREDDDES
jgi:hypothetical protein